jgi:hypothetical protein
MSLFCTGSTVVTVAVSLGDDSLSFTALFLGLGTSGFPGLLVSACLNVSCRVLSSAHIFQVSSTEPPEWNSISFHELH